jgi:hypothetical protein
MNNYEVFPDISDAELKSLATTKKLSVTAVVSISKLWRNEKGESKLVQVEQVIPVKATFNTDVVRILREALCKMRTTDFDEDVTISISYQESWKHVTFFEASCVIPERAVVRLYTEERGLQLANLKLPVEAWLEVISDHKIYDIVNTKIGDRDGALFKRALLNLLPGAFTYKTLIELLDYLHSKILEGVIWRNTFVPYENEYLRVTAQGNIRFPNDLFWIELVKDTPGMLFYQQDDMDDVFLNDVTHLKRIIPLAPIR